MGVERLARYDVRSQRFDSMLGLKKNSLVLPMIVLAAIFILIAVATLQYHWASELSDAEDKQIGIILESLMLAWHLDFYHEFRTVADAFPDRGMASPQNLRSYRDDVAEWKRTAAHPTLVSEVLIAHSADPTRIMRLDVRSGAAAPSPIPHSVVELLAQLREDSTHPERRGDAEFPLTPAAKVKPGTQILDSHSGWIFDQNIPALLHPMPPSTRAEDISRTPGWIILVLDRQTIQDLVVPALSERYFGTGVGKNYKVLFQSASTVPSVIYYSDSQHQSNEHPDLSMNIFGPPAGSTEGQFWEVARIAAPPAGAEHLQFTAPIWFPVVRYTPFDGDWNLILQPREASSNSVLKSARRRNIALSSGVLLLLALSMALIVVASRRAEQLAEMQMNFVTSVSHDLRTPLAVIRTASDNLGAGVVSDQEHLKMYATAIRNQTLQLTDLVEQVLLFASTRQHKLHVLLRLTPPLEAIRNALNSTSALMEASGIQIDTQLEPQLPQVLADCSALSRAIQNLLTNAINYGRGSGKIALRACHNVGVNPGEVQITVTDQGPGIPNAELGRIFEPFYRSPLAVKAGVHGTGLGLFLARTIVESMGGKLTVKSAVGQGSSFTIHLPVAAAAAMAEAAQPQSGQRI